MTSEAHLIEGTKDTADLFRSQIIAPFIAAVCKVTGLHAHLLTHNTSARPLPCSTCSSSAAVTFVGIVSAYMNNTTSQPSLNTLIAATQPHLSCHPQLCIILGSSLMKWHCLSLHMHIRPPCGQHCNNIIAAATRHILNTQLCQHPLWQHH